MTDNTNENTLPNGNTEPEQQINPGAIRKSTTQSILKAAQNATGMEFNSMEDMLAALARLSSTQDPQTNQREAAQLSADMSQEQQNRRNRVTTNDLQDQFQQMRKDLELKDQRLKEREIESGIRNTLGDRFDNDLMDYTITKLKSQVVEQDGDLIVVNSKNQQRYNENGSPMSVRELADEMARQNPKLLKQSIVNTGSGLRPQGSMFGNMPGDNESIPDYSKDPAAFNSWANKRGLGRGVGLKGVTTSLTNSSQVKKII